MGPKIIQHDNLDKTPQGAAGDAAPWGRRPLVLLEWRGLLVLCGFIGFIVLIIIIAYGQRIGWWLQDNGWLPYVLIGVVLLFALKRFVLVEQPGGYKVFFWQASGKEVTRGMLVTQRTYAARTFPNAAQLTLTNTPLAPVVEDDTVDADVITTVPMLPPSEWLPWFDTRPHGLLAAETGGGKSTTFKAVVKSRIERGELVFLIDPHSSDWFGLPSIGGGEDWSAVWAGMQVVIDEYHRRMQERDIYLRQNNHELPHTHFPRITVLLDEANAACLQLSTAKRGEKSKWDQFALALGSGARKVGISIQLLAQSANVEDLQLSGPMVNNFTRLCLDARSVLYLVRQSLDDAERKRELLDAVNGLPYPAAAMQNGRVVLLDRTGLDTIGAPHNPRAALWVEGYEKAETLIGGRTLPQPARSVVSAAAVTSTTVRASVPAPDPLEQYRKMKFVDDAARIGWLAYHTKLGTREIREIVGCHYPTVVAVAGNVRSAKKRREGENRG